MRRKAYKSHVLPCYAIKAEENIQPPACHNNASSSPSPTCDSTREGTNTFPPRYDSAPSCQRSRGGVLLKVSTTLRPRSVPPQTQRDRGERTMDTCQCSPDVLLNVSTTAPRSAPPGHADRRTYEEIEARGYWMRVNDLQEAY